MLPNTEEEEEYVMLSPKKDYVIEAINVTNSECPLKNVTLAEVVGAEAGESWKNLTIDSNSSMVAVSFPNITTSIARYDFRIKIEAHGGAVAHTQAARVKYIDCENDIPIQNENEELLNVTFEVGELYAFSKSVRSSFDSLKECPIKRFKIDRIIVVMVNETISEKDDYATISNQGKLKLNYFSSAKPKMEIYISASTSMTKENGTWSVSEKPLAIQEIKLKNAPNIKPNFMRPLED